MKTTYTSGSVKLIGVYGSDDLIASKARYSYDKSSSPTEILIPKLVKNGHWTPFEFASMDFEINCPIFVARQWVRHRTASINERSGRYNKIEPKFFKLMFRIPNLLETTINEWSITWDGALNVYQQACEKAFDSYKELLQLGVPKEQARAVLPLSMMTRFAWTMDLRNLLHFLDLRLASGAQQETRYYALKIAKFVEKSFPITFKAWRETKAN